MYLTGFADEAAQDFDLQIKATKELGWRHIEARQIIGERNLSALTDREFDAIEQKLRESGVSINCFGSSVGNWSRSILDSPESSYEEFRLAIPRMQKLGIKLIRMMSFSVPDDRKAGAWDLADEAVKRVSVIVKMAEDAGITCLHENCMCWGGLSFEHTLYLLDKIQSPAFRLVFDTGNPVFNLDYSGNPPYDQKQSSWEFYDKVREFVSYIHIKDGRRTPVGAPQIFTYAGEGDGEVERILTDLFRRGYDGGVSIEPHLATVFHSNDNPDNTETQLARRYQTYVEYGKRVEAIIHRIKNSL